MSLTWPVVGAVLFAALLHASWNAVVKSSTDKPLDNAVLHGLAGLLALPLAFLVGPPPAAAWPYLLTSVAIHLGYHIALTQAYRHGDLGLTYPLMRGTGPLLVALSAGVVVGERLSTLAWLGVAGVCGGVLLLGLSPVAMRQPRAVAFALANAVIIALYTMVDALGVRASGNALQYVLTLFALNGWPFALLVYTRRGPAVVWPYVRMRWRIAVVGGIASVGSYGIALWAMTRAPVATIAALRETSVLFAAVLGWWLLKEAFTLQRAWGTAAIVVGVMALRLG